MFFFGINAELFANYSRIFFEVFPCYYLRFYFGLIPVFSFRIISKLFAHYFRITFALFPRYFPSISELFSHYSVPAPKHPQVTTSNGGNARVFFIALFIDLVLNEYVLSIS